MLNKSRVLPRGRRVAWFAAGAVAALFGSVTFAGAADSGPTFFACAKAGKIDPATIRVDIEPTCGRGATIVSWEDGGAPTSLDALAGTPCRQGTPAAGTVVLTYAAGGVATLTCDASNKPTLSVVTAGDGFGTVASAPSGIECGAASASTTLTDCTEAYPFETSVVLTATPSTSPFSQFTGWTGACTNTSGTCTVTMTEARSVTATFVSATAPPADPSTCDPGIFVGSPTAAQLAGALGVCPSSNGSAGVLTSTIAQGDGTTLGSHIHTGVMTAFGTGGFAAQQGSTMAVLSSGAARDKNDPGWIAPEFGMSGAGASVKPPLLVAGDPDPGCPHPTSVYDDPTLTVTLRAPTNATGFSFQYNYFASEYPNWVCSVFSDNFYVTMDPMPAGSTDGNIAFDDTGNVVTASSSRHCSPFGGFFCPLGTAALTGTGYETDGATGWNTVAAPVTGGSEFTLTFRIWDTSDPFTDSLVLLDDFRWTSA